MEARLNRRGFLKTLGLATAALTIPACRSTTGVSATGSKKRPPNFVIIFIDDMGYADVGCFGATGYETPNIDRMAAQGTRFTDFYAASSVCTPSRAALMTGCYPQRVGLPQVLGPGAKIGISDSEMTIAQMLKPLGYATACFGKWHLGHLPQFLPTHHGFDEYFGLPYSNDMWPRHPENPKAYPELPLVEGDQVVTHDPDQTQLTTWYTERAVRFIEKNKDRPFFLYVPHSMVHVPLHVSDKFKGKSKQGLFGDVVMEVDWSVGQILDTLRRLKLDQDTMVVFCSDNGPWLSYGEHAGSAKPLREGKGTSFDGGQREPTIMWWPGKIPAGKVCREPATTMDLLPTIAGRSGAKLPDHKIDGKDIWSLASGQSGAKSPHEAFFYYSGWALDAVRSGPWKLHFPHGYRTLGGRPGGTGGIPAKYEQAKIDLALFNLENDVSEQHNVAAQHPDVVARLQQLAEAMRQDLGDGKKEGPGRRPPGKA
ncbi:MAG: sulfatase-like hydrolase/transferase [Planctomycetes bacterium]|jgi:arylsulfatase A-like enzyme|nr:sulfatase-like hydrolase/transferase [Planctomycetota bacterium]